MVRTAYTLRAEDDDWGLAGTLVRDVMNDVERKRMVDNVVGHLRAGVSEPVLQRAFDYWRNIATPTSAIGSKRVSDSEPNHRRRTDCPQHDVPRR